MTAKTPAAALAAQAALRELAQIVAVVAPIVPQFAAYALALDVALDLLSDAVGTIEPTPEADIAEAEKFDHLGMGF